MQATTGKRRRVVMACLWVAAAVNLALATMTVGRTHSNSGGSSERNVESDEISKATVGEESSRTELQGGASRKRPFTDGTWRQLTEDGEALNRYLHIDSVGKGRLSLHFGDIERFFVGAPEVEIETAWVVEDDQVTFTLTAGKPEEAYRRLLAMTLEEITVFDIRSMKDQRLVLVRVPDGEVFEWRLAE